MDTKFSNKSTCDLTLHPKASKMDSTLIQQSHASSSPSKKFSYEKNLEPASGQSKETETAKPKQKQFKPTFAKSVQANIEDIITAIGLFGHQLEKMSLKDPNFPTPKREPKVIIHCVRHAQAHNNVRPDDFNFDLNYYLTIDPELTARGLAQAKKLESTFEPMSRITYILCSPLTRTIQTALFGFSPLFTKNKQLILWPLLRESGFGRYSTGSSISALQKHQTTSSPPIIDFSLLEEGWETDLDKNAEVTRKRAEKVRSELWKLGEEASKVEGGKWMHLDLPENREGKDVEILVISHGGFLQALAKEVVMGFYNTMHKSFEFVQEGGGGESFKLVETEESRKRVRGFMGERRREDIEAAKWEASAILFMKNGDKPPGKQGGPF